MEGALAVFTLASEDPSVHRTRAGKEVGPMAKSSSSRVTSKRVATKASKALSDGRSSARTRSIAGSALSQAKAKRSK